jgi:hypothetical protein
MMPLHYMRLPSLSLPSNPKKYKGGLPKEPRRAQKHRSLTVYASPGREQKNCLHFSICACHPCAGAMLIFSVSFQF